MMSHAAAADRHLAGEGLAGGVFQGPGAAGGGPRQLWDSLLGASLLERLRGAGAVVPAFMQPYLDSAHLVVAAVAAYVCARVGLGALAVPLALMAVHAETVVRQLSLADAEERAVSHRGRLACGAGEVLSNISV